MGVPCPKVRKRIRTKKDADKALDKAENKKVPKRSGGRCEVHVQVLDGVLRCWNVATQIHHMIGGWGKRGRGRSALRDHKQHVCEGCHRSITGDIGGKKLIRVGGVIPHYTDCYKRPPSSRGGHG